MVWIVPVSPHFKILLITMAPEATCNTLKIKFGLGLGDVLGDLLGDHPSDFSMSKSVGCNLYCVGIVRSWILQSEGHPS